jgi:hypothetical protein
MNDVQSVRCDVCGIWTTNPHEPHDRGCTHNDCQCDHIVCSGCCWDCKP